MRASPAAVPSILLGHGTLVYIFICLRPLSTNSKDLTSSFSNTSDILCTKLGNGGNGCIATSTGGF